MTCRGVQNRISAYLDRELAGREMLAVRDHLDACPSCRAEVEEFARLKGLLGSMPTPQPTADFEERLIVDLRRHAAVRQRRTPRLMLYVGVAAASMLATLALLSVAQRAPTPSPEPVVYGVQLDQSSSVGPDPYSGAPLITTAGYGR